MTKDYRALMALGDEYHHRLDAFIAGAKAMLDALVDRGFIHQAYAEHARKETEDIHGENRPKT